MVSLTKLWLLINYICGVGECLIISQCVHGSAVFHVEKDRVWMFEVKNQVTFYFKKLSFFTVTAADPGVSTAFENICEWVIPNMFHHRNACQSISESPFLTHAPVRSVVFILCVILVHSLTFNTCPGEMQMPKEHNGSLPVWKLGCKGR